jgi:hypothetical protein
MGETTVLHELAAIREELRKLRLEISKQQRDSRTAKDVIRYLVRELQDDYRDELLIAMRRLVR